MHFVSESAMTLREQKRWETSHRITLAAQQLVDEHGLDGFTMEDLASAAEVSRRTLFNYFPSKLDAVLGESPAVPEAAVEAFRSGGPHGNLIEDLAELAKIAVETRHPGHDDIRRARRLLSHEPRLFAAAHHRFETITIEFTELVIEREGADFGADRARLLLRLLLALFDVSLDCLVDDPRNRPLVSFFDEQLAAARELLA